MMTDLDQMQIDGSAISHQGLMLLGYQRTKQISRKARLSLEAGEPGVLSDEITRRGPEVFTGALREIHAEYVPVRDLLRAEAIHPKRVVDIGCGQAINDVFLAADFSPQFTLIDIEDTPEKYHLWSHAGSGYAALKDAEAFLIANGVAADHVQTINPRRSPDAMAAVAGDLVTSLFSCGFHYPVGEYIDLMCRTIEQGGAVLLDLRQRYLASPDGALKRLLQSGRQDIVLTMEKSKRILFRA
jgi:hypothetical protein